MLELRAVSKRWAGFGLHDVSLHVPPGEYFVLLGPSGAGKSLLLELIAGFHAPDSGSIRLGGRDVTHTPPELRGIGFVYQDSMLFPHHTPRQNIAYGPRLRRRPPAEVAQTVERLAAMVHITHVLDRDPAALSGGERQRVAIARALAVRPQLLLMDEPLGALDPLTQATLRAELKRLHREAGLTVLHVTHDQAEARELGRRIGVLDAGRLLQVGKAADIFERPGSAFVAEFTGGENIYAGLASAHDGVTLFRAGERGAGLDQPGRGPGARRRAAGERADQRRAGEDERPQPACRPRGRRGAARARLRRHRRLRRPGHDGHGHRTVGERTRPRARPPRLLLLQGPQPAPDRRRIALEPAFGRKCR